MRELLVLVVFLGIVGMPIAASAVPPSVMMDDFEGYVDNADLYAAWGEGGVLYNLNANGASYSLDSSVYYEGGTSMRIDWDSTALPYGTINVALHNAFDVPRSTERLALLSNPLATGIRLAFKGDAANTKWAYGMMQYTMVGTGNTGGTYLFDGAFVVTPGGSSLNLPDGDSDWHVVEIYPNGGLPITDLYGLAEQFVLTAVDTPSEGVAGDNSGPIWFDAVEVIGVPEPATMALLGFGAVALFSRKKR